MLSQSQRLLLLGCTFQRRPNVTKTPGKGRAETFERVACCPPPHLTIRLPCSSVDDGYFRGDFGKGQATCSEDDNSAVECIQ